MTPSLALDGRGNQPAQELPVIAEEFNKRTPAGVKFEIIGIDNKLSPRRPRAPALGHGPGARAMWSKATAPARAGHHGRAGKAQRPQPGKEVLF